MIIKALALLVKNLLSVLLVVSIPSLPLAVFDALLAATGYLTAGLSILLVFVGNEAMTVMAACLSLVIAVELFMQSWQFVWWILSKIPALNVGG